MDAILPCDEIEDAAFEAADSAALYLLHEVYPSHDKDSIFRLYEPIEAQINRVQMLSGAAGDGTSEGQHYLASLVQVSDALMRHARDGDLESLHETLLDLRQDEVLYPCTEKMLLAAVKAGQLHVAEYIRRRGLPLPQPADTADHSAVMDIPVLRNMIDEIVTKWILADEDEEAEMLAGMRKVDELLLGAISTVKTTREMRENATNIIISGLNSMLTAVKFKEGIVWPLAPPAAAAAIAASGLNRLPFTPAISVIYASLVLHAPVNTQRSHDGYTPLHLAACQGQLGLVAALLCAGADPNAIANDETTPLSAAQLAHREADSAQSKSICAAICDLIKSYGGEASWREAMSAIPFKSTAAILPIKQDILAAKNTNSLIATDGNTGDRRVKERELSLVSVGGGCGPIIGAVTLADAKTADDINTTVHILPRGATVSRTTAIYTVTVEEND